LQATEKLHKYNKYYYDSRHTKLTKYNEGDYVMIHNLHSKIGQSVKLKLSYKNPYVVKRALNNDRYVVSKTIRF